jgi:hypothetical protein
MGNDVTTVRIPGLTFGGAIQVSNTTIITTALAAVAISLIGCHFMGGMKKGKEKRKEWKRHSPQAIENKVMKDVMAFSTNINTVAHNMPQIRNMVHTLNGRIKDQIRAYTAGEITQAQFDSSVRNLYPVVLNEMGIPANTVPQHVVNKLDATIDRVAEKILEGRLPVKVKFRMYKNNPGLSQLHDLGRKRAMEMGRGHKYGLQQQAMHTSAGIYLKPASSSSNFGAWQRP